MADYDLQYQDTHIDALLATANELKNAGYIYKGVATPSTNPGTPTERVAYLASEPGTYTNFGGIVITSGLYSLTYASGTWTGTQMSAGSDIQVVQTTGQSTNDVMSQKAVTDSLNSVTDALGMNEIIQVCTMTSNNAVSTYPYSIHAGDKFFVKPSIGSGVSYVSVTTRRDNSTVELILNRVTTNDEVEFVAAQDADEFGFYSSGGSSSVVIKQLVQDIAIDSYPEYGSTKVVSSDGIARSIQDNSGYENADMGPYTSGFLFNANWIYDKNRPIYHRVIKVESDNKFIKVVANNTSPSILCFLKTYTRPTATNEPADVCDGYSSFTRVDNTSVLKIPSDCGYIVVGVQYVSGGGVTTIYEPAYVGIGINGQHIINIVNNIESVLGMPATKLCKLISNNNIVPFVIDVNIGDKFKINAELDEGVNYLTITTNDNGNTVQEYVSYKTDRSQEFTFVASVNAKKFRVYSSGGSSSVIISKVDNKLSIPRRKIKYLAIGNSVNQDAATYIPYLLRELYGNDVDFEIGICYIGSYTIAKYTELLGDTQLTTFTYASNTAILTNMTGYTLQQAMEFADWNIVTMQMYQTSTTQYIYLEDVTKAPIFLRYLKDNTIDGCLFGLVTPATYSDMRATYIQWQQDILTSCSMDFLLDYGATKELWIRAGVTRDTSTDNGHSDEGFPCESLALTAIHMLADVFKMEDKASNKKSQMSQDEHSLLNIPNQQGTFLVATADEWYKLVCSATNGWRVGTASYMIANEALRNNQ